MTELLKRSRPGMTTLKDMPILQDMPPPGGFPAIRIDRRLPSTGPTGVTILACAAAVMAYGYYKVFHKVVARRRMEMEDQLIFAAIQPALVAEWDINYVKIMKEAAEKRGELAHKIPGGFPVNPWAAEKQLRWIPPRMDLSARSPFLG